MFSVPSLSTISEIRYARETLQVVTKTLDVKRVLRPPSNISSLRCFLAVSMVYRRFVPKLFVDGSLIECKTKEGLVLISSIWRSVACRNREIEGEVDDTAI